jgi:hypothetical protein
MTTIEQIKDALQAHIAEAEAATPGPWYYWDQKENDLIATGKEKGKLICSLPGLSSRPKEFTFIAHARTMSPTACKCLLLAIEGLEAAHAISIPFEYSPAWDSLKSIRQEWHNLTTINNH